MDIHRKQEALTCQKKNVLHVTARVLATHVKVKAVAHAIKAVCVRRVKGGGQLVATNLTMTLTRMIQVGTRTTGINEYRVIVNWYKIA